MQFSACYKWTGTDRHNHWCLDSALQPPSKFPCPVEICDDCTLTVSQKLHIGRTPCSEACTQSACLVPGVAMLASRRFLAVGPVGAKQTALASLSVQSVRLQPECQLSMWQCYFKGSVRMPPQAQMRISGVRRTTAQINRRSSFGVLPSTVSLVSCVPLEAH